MVEALYDLATLRKVEALYLRSHWDVERDGGSKVEE